jgi:hypothetical protein
LSTKDLNLGHLKRKFTRRYIGPFQVTAKINDNAYRIHTPRLWRGHDVINVERLRPLHENEFQRDQVLSRCDAALNTNNPLRIKQQSMTVSILAANFSMALRAQTAYPNQPPFSHRNCTPTQTCSNCIMISSGNNLTLPSWKSSSPALIGET